MKKLLLLFLIAWPSCALAVGPLIFNPPPVVLEDATTANAADVNANFATIRTDGNAWEANLLGAVASLNSVPIGAVSFFSTPCPTGWVSADGNLGSPDTRGRYIRGFGTGAGGASAARGVLVADTLPSHSHGPGQVAIRSLNTDGTSRFGGSFYFAMSTSTINTNTDSDGVSGGGRSGVQTRPLGYVTYSCYHSSIPPGTAGTIYFSQPIVQLPRQTVPHASDLMANFNRIVSDGNSSFTTLQTRVNGLSSASVPTGAVVPFHLSSCPTGWKASDGTSGTVDLRGSFPRSVVGSGRALGNFQGGALQDHTHFYGSGTPTSLNSVSSFLAHWTAGGKFTFNSANGPVNTGNAGGGTAILPKHVSLLYCQKI